LRKKKKIKRGKIVFFFFSGRFSLAFFLNLSSHRESYKMENNKHMLKKRILFSIALGNKGADEEVKAVAPYTISSLET
jgi:hypothetical protein